jgi:hypothetical protein
VKKLAQYKNEDTRGHIDAEDLPVFICDSCKSFFTGTTVKVLNVTQSLNYIQGRMIRYHCFECDNFDYCGACHKTTEHEHDMRIEPLIDPEEIFKRVSNASERVTHLGFYQPT